MVCLSHAPDVRSYLPRSSVRARQSAACLVMARQCRVVPGRRFPHPLLFPLSRWPLRPPLDGSDRGTLDTMEFVLALLNRPFSVSGALDSLLSGHTGPRRLCPDLSLLARLEHCPAPANQVGYLRIQHSDCGILTAEYRWPRLYFVSEPESVSYPADKSTLL